METEIELKLFVSPDFAFSIRDKIADLTVLQDSQQELVNIYYDTPNLLLRQHDIGLRVRQSNGHFVQTVKTAGRVVAGLHQRPEYNAPCQSMVPELSLFPADTWPTTLDVGTLSSQLAPLFSTNFLRQHWLLAMPDGSQIELAFDLGEVSVPENGKDVICEVELELISGEIDALFVLANKLTKNGGVRLGNLSKAARGYRLASNYQGDKINPLAVVALTSNMSTEQAFIITLEHALSHWLYHEQIYIERSEPEAIVEIGYAIGLIHQALTFYAGVIPRRSSILLRQELLWLEGELAWIHEARAIARLGEDKGHFLRKLNAKKILRRKLSERYQQLSTSNEVSTLFHSERYCKVLLSLNHWILTRAWRPFLDDKTREKLTGSVLDFANRSLAHSWDELLNILAKNQEMDRLAFVDFQPLLLRNLLTGCCLASLYDVEARETFRLPWLDLFQGIEDILLLEPIRTQLTADEITDEDKIQIEKWLQGKEESILYAMAQSQKMGITLPPYWHRL